VTSTVEAGINRPSSDTSTESDGYVGLADVTSRATRMALSYEGCRTMMERKAKEIKSTEYRVELRRLTMMPGWREVLLLIFFPDNSAIQVRLELDRDRVIWAKNYLD